MAEHGSSTRRDLLKLAATLGFGALANATPLNVNENPIPVPDNDFYWPFHWKLLEGYSQWLHYERRELARMMYPGFDGAHRFVPQDTGLDTYHGTAGVKPVFCNALCEKSAMVRAGTILRAAGVNLDGYYHSFRDQRLVAA